ncbi:DUF2975 domain-containing protein [uncultured Mucilaginibacter sp.]|uniref:DUF2975 domain-containing protein n=1 Tax=uncultured Mucilaginibacter sp. TaxID=797541 RepID=UPI0025E83654|nr:DUF2975 domain-containing protein [uncultured Mucilaginibacter sp.]
MKFKFNTNLIVNIVIIGYVLLILAMYVSFSYPSLFGGSQSTVNNEPFIPNVSNNDLKAFDEEAPANLTSSYYHYKQFNDSVKTIRELRNGEYWMGGGQVFASVLATEENLQCDTCSKKWLYDRVFNFKEHNDAKKYGIDHFRWYIKLPGWKLNDARWALGPDSIQFYAKGGQSFIRKIIVHRGKRKDTVVKIWNTVDQPVKFNYNHRDRAILIPCSRSAKHAVDIIIIIVNICLALYFLYLISGFLKFVLDLSKGLAFTGKNVRRLRLIGLSLLIYPVGIFALNYLIWLIFHNYFTEDVVLNGNLWTNNWKTIGVGIVFLALFKAFRQGKLLKDEQDLTV